MAGAAQNRAEGGSLVHWSWVCSLDFALERSLREMHALKRRRKLVDTS